eukprot:scaffold7542_cov124-Isochrysis_galbana.AAC.5
MSPGSDGRLTPLSRLGGGAADGACESSFTLKSGGDWPPPMPPMLLLPAVACSCGRSNEEELELPGAAHDTLPRPLTGAKHIADPGWTC